MMLSGYPGQRGTDALGSPPTRRCATSAWSGRRSSRIAYRWGSRPLSAERSGTEVDLLLEVIIRFQTQHAA